MKANMWYLSKNFEGQKGKKILFGQSQNFRNYIQAPQIKKINSRYLESTWHSCWNFKKKFRHHVFLGDYETRDYISYSTGYMKEN